MLERSSIGENSNTGARRKFWMPLWNMKIPNKIKNFAWRVYKYILPSKVDFAKRYIIVETFCDFCAAEIENGLSALFSYPHVHRVWRDCFPNIDFS